MACNGRLRPGSATVAEACGAAADVGYVVDWLRCAQENGLAVSYVGGWNEHYQGTPVQRAWFVNLRAALDAAGFTGTQIVAADDTPQLREGPAAAGVCPAARLADRRR